MKRRVLFSGLALLGWTALLGMPFVAQAQFIDFQAEQQGIPFTDDPSLSRLISMGGLRFVIPDENNEINLADFGGNVAGIAADKDGWSVEWTYDKLRNTDDASLTRRSNAFVQRTVVTQEMADWTVIYRNGNGRAFGGSYRWDAQSVNVRVGDDSKARGPKVSALWNERIGPFRLGTSFHRFADNEDITSADIYAIRHFSESWIWRFGAATDLLGLQWAGQIDLERNTIEGKSRDPSGFHQDDYRWLRPATKGRLSLLLPEGSDLEAGVNLSFLDRSGREEAEISWSDRFPANPGGFNYDQKLGTFEEDESGLELEARALYWLSWAPRVGGYFRYGDFSSDVVESSNFIGSRRAGSLDRTETVFGGGAATSLWSDRFTLGVEGESRLTTTEAEVARAFSVIDAREISLRGGIEWFARPNLAFRSGYEYRTTDTDIDAPFTLRAGSAGSIGVGYVPNGGTITVDGYFRYLDQEPSEDGGENRDVGQWQLGIYSRMLF